MSFHSIFPFISAMIFLTTGLFCFFKNRKSIVNISFSILCLATFWWQFAWTILFSSKDTYLIETLVKIGYSGIIFIPIAFYHFIISFLDIKKEKRFLFVYYMIGFVFLTLLWKGYFFIDGYRRFPWGAYPKASFLHPFYLFFLFFLAIRGVNFLYLHSKNEKTPSLKRNQIKYVLIATLVYIFSSSDFIINYGVKSYPFGFIFVLFAIPFIAYAIVRHQLMEIEVIIKKSLVFAGMFAFAFGVFVTVALLVSQLFGEED